MEYEPTDDPRTIKMTPELRQVMDEQLDRFRVKFGREPGRNDPVFFNPDADRPEPMPDEQMRNIEAIWQEHDLEKVRAESEARLEAAGMIEHHRSEKKVGRNDRCPCGSGLKFKRCHGN